MPSHALVREKSLRALPSLVSSAYAAAVSSGHVIFSETELAVVRTGAGVPVSMYLEGFVVVDFWSIVRGFFLIVCFIGMMRMDLLTRFCYCCGGGGSFFFCLSLQCRCGGSILALALALALACQV